ncbi:hypothetical protein [Sphingomonas sp. CCH10-B3]|uniref:hypothetical protein n=1 Tax=Sphingomonas sp. CCH10-B3 TaxID=1768757 RepID=UPI000AAED16D|nr:hypothetical protein [Sphingomonas sp. CCH10-B3]
MATPPPSQDALRTIGLAAFENFTPDAAGPASAEKILERLSAARANSSKEANRFLYISLAFVGLYIVRVAGLRMDLVIFDQKVFEVPHGLFFFCLGSQLSLCISFAKNVDARVFDRLMRSICDHQWHHDSLAVYRTIPNEHAWLETSSQIMHALPSNIISRNIFIFVMILTSLLGLIIMFSPVAAGLYIIVDWKLQITNGWIDLQYYLVLTSTCLSLAWFVNYVAVHLTDHDD